MKAESEETQADQVRREIPAEALVIRIAIRKTPDMMAIQACRPRRIKELEKEGRRVRMEQ